MKILAMDLGKRKTVSCIYDSAAGEHTFGKVFTRPQAIHDLLVESEPDRVVFEICPAAGWIYDICRSLGLEAQVANPSTEGWRWKNVKKKNDRTDALKLARLSAGGDLPLVHMPEPEIRQWRSLIKYRKVLVGRQTAIKNSIRAILGSQGLSMPAGKSGWTKQSVAQLGEMAGPANECGALDLWRGQLRAELEQLEHVEEALGQVTDKLNELGKTNKKVRLLRTVAGVGPRAAEAIAAFVDEPERFASGKQVGSYGGLAPRQYQSGAMDRQGKISKLGNSLLRAMLVEVSWLGLRHNDWMRETYERVLRGSESRKKVAIVAVARKLLVRCWAMMRDGTEWREPEIEERVQAA